MFQPPQKHSTFIFSLRIIFPCVLLCFLLTPDTLRLKDKYKPDFDALNQKYKNSHSEQEISELKMFIKMESEKVFSEKESRLQTEGNLFKFKLYAIGLLLFNFIISPFFVKSNVNSQSNLLRVANVSLSTNILVIAIAFVASLSIDVYLIYNRNIIDLNGVWLSEVAESLFTGENAVDYMSAKSILPWEQFLRVHYGLKSDPLMSTVSWISLYFTTIALFALFLLFLQARVNTNSMKNTGDVSEYIKVGKISYQFINLSLIVSVFIIHAHPDIFYIETPLIPLIQCNNLLCLVCYYLACVSLILFNYFFIFEPFKKNAYHIYQDISKRSDKYDYSI